MGNKISLAVRANREKIDANEAKVDPDVCALHRESCAKEQAVYTAGITATLMEIKASIDKINERHERYQEALLRNLGGE